MTPRKKLTAKKDNISPNKAEQLQEVVDNTEIAEYLQKVSQSIYNLRKIIDAHFIEPIEEDKDLNHRFYLNEIDTLQELLSVPVGPQIISPDNINKISKDLMFNRGKTENDQIELDTASDYIKKILGKVQFMRRKYYGTNIPTQGLEEGPLKIFIEDMLMRKKNTRNIKDEKKFTQVGDEICIGPLKYKDFSISYENVPLKLTPQLVKLCTLFIERNQNVDSFVSDNSIRDVVTVNDYISIKNIEKLVSKLRRVLKKENKHIKIQRINGQGYKLITENIR